MPLPQLQTGGIDVGNTLARINAMRMQDLQMKNLESEMANREALRPSLIEERQGKAEERRSQNALRLVQEKGLAQKNKADLVSAMAKDVAWIKGNPDPEKAYTFTQQHYAKKGFNLPNPDLFYTQADEDSPAKFDKEKFAKFADEGINAMNLALNPKEGERAALTLANPNFDKTKPQTADNPKMIKKQYVVTGGKMTEAPDLPPEPIIDVFTKEEREAAKQAETERHNLWVRAHGDETLATQKERNAEDVKYRKAMLALGEKREKREATKEAAKTKVKQIIKRPTGEILRVMTSGDVEIMDVTTGDWRAATPEEAKDAAILGKEPSALEKLIAERRKTSGGKTYTHTATGKNGQKIGWNGTAWEDVKTGKVLQ